MLCKCELALRFANAIDELVDYLEETHDFDLGKPDRTDLLMACVECEDTLMFLKKFEVKEN